MRRFLVWSWIGLVAACTPEVPTGPSDPAHLAVIGTPRAGTPGWLLADPLVVKVTDAAGRPMAGVTVTWHAMADGGQLESDVPGPAPQDAWYSPSNRSWLEVAVSRTDADGVARTRYMAGWATGNQRILASAGEATTNLDVPVAGMALHSVVMAGDRACGLDADGRLLCWVPRWSARENAPETVPAQVRPVAAHGTERFSAVVGGGTWAVRTQMCALTVAGALRCFTGTDFDASGAVTPVPVVTPVPFAAIVGSTDGLAGVERGWLCGLDAGGQAWCRGQNDDGQLGDGSQISRATFAPVAGSQRFVRLVAGAWRVCGLDADGGPWCWGSGSNVGGATPAERNARVPTRVTARTYSALAAVGGTLCGVAVTTRLFECQKTSAFPLTVGQSGVPGAAVAVPGNLAVRDISSGDGYGDFAIMNDGQIGAFGFQANFDLMLPGIVFAGELRGFNAFVAGAPGATCAAHESGSTICLNGLYRPIGIPMP